MFIECSGVKSFEADEILYFIVLYPWYVVDDPELNYTEPIASKINNCNLLDVD